MNEFQGKKYVQELWLNEVLHRSELQSSYDEGEINKQYEIAKNLIYNDVNPKIINSSTGLSLEEINKLKNKIKILKSKQ